MKNYALCALGNETFRVPKESKVLLFLVTGTVSKLIQDDLKF